MSDQLAACGLQKVREFLQALAAEMPQLLAVRVLYGTIEAG